MIKVIRDASLADDGRHIGIVEVSYPDKTDWDIPGFESYALNSSYDAPQISTFAPPVTQIFRISSLSYTVYAPPSARR